jgi:hypothetical protein
MSDFFIPAPEPKTAKNRLHLDLRAPDTIEARSSAWRAWARSWYASTPG